MQKPQHNSSSPALPLAPSKAWKNPVPPNQPLFLGPSNWRACYPSERLAASQAVSPAERQRSIWVPHRKIDGFITYISTARWCHRYNRKHPLQIRSVSMQMSFSSENEVCDSCEFKNAEEHEEASRDCSLFVCVCVAECRPARSLSFWHCSSRRSIPVRKQTQWASERVLNWKQNSCFTCHS